MNEPTFAETLDRAIVARGVSLARLSDMLTALGDPVSVAALSSWRKGRRIPRADLSLDAVRRLEELLWLDEGSLVSRIPLRRTPGPDSRRLFDDILAEVGPRPNTTELAIRLGHEVRDTVVTSAHQTYDIGPDRHALRCRFQLFLEARVDGARSYLLMWQFDESPRGIPVVSSVAGAHLGEHVYDEEHRTFVADLVLSRPLRRGEPAVIECVIEGIGEGEGTTQLRHALPRRINEASLWIRFDPKVRPRRCRLHLESDKERIDTSARLVDGALHRVVRGFGPGWFGFEWSWMS